MFTSHANSSELLSYVMVIKEEQCYQQNINFIPSVLHS
jgi:hypothetical protein